NTAPCFPADRFGGRSLSGSVLLAFCLLRQHKALPRITQATPEYAEQVAHGLKNFTLPETKLKRQGVNGFVYLVHSVCHRQLENAPGFVVADLTAAQGA